MAPASRRYPVGVELVRDGASVRVWAPDHDRVTLVVQRADEVQAVALERDADGYHAGVVADVVAGMRYGFRLGESTDVYPDPASRSQPDGPSGLSAIVDPDAFAWSDTTWRGIPRHAHVIYELHVGTFTPGGTWQAAAERLDEVRDVGVTTIEMMPVAEFAGPFGWGYDGVTPYAPYHHYGTPDDLRAFVDRAHALGLAVILDVVYNHFGPEGCYLTKYARHYQSDRHHNEWGEPPDYDGEASGPVREFIVSNARYWIEAFHFDGLRLDATQAIPDDSPRHILADVAEAVRHAGGLRETLVVAENEPQHTRLVRPHDAGGYAIDALWNDDFHHSAIVAATGRCEAYYCDHRGTAMEFVAAARHGYLYQGQRYSWQGAPRGTAGLDLAPHQFVHFLENHDQVANSARGLRLHQETSPARLRALTALLLLGPQIPMLFQGQEFASSAPFLFFGDMSPDLRAAVRDGRREFLAQFPSLLSPDMQALLADPSDPATRARCVIDWRERDAHGSALALHRDLLHLRRTDPVIAGTTRERVDAATLSTTAFLIRYIGDRSTSSPGDNVGDRDDRLLVVNLGGQWEPPSIPEPLIAPPDGCDWLVVWSSEAAIYGGAGSPPAISGGRWRLAPDSAVLAIATPTP